MQDGWSWLFPRDFCEFIANMWHNPNVIGSINDIDICLIAKISKPEFVNQFKPIKLCNVCYKVLY